MAVTPPRGDVRGGTDVGCVGDTGGDRNRRSEPRPAAGAGHLQGARRDQHRDGDRRHGESSRGHGGTAARRRFCGWRRSRPLAGAAQGKSRRASEGKRRAQTDPARRPYRCRPGQPRGLVNRSIQAGRTGRIFLRARQLGRQIYGGVLCHQSHSLQEGRLQTRPRHHPGAGDRRGNFRQQCPGNSVAAETPPRPDRCRIRAQRGRCGRIEGWQTDPQFDPDQRKGPGELRA